MTKMRKLTLDIETLGVQSFPTTEGGKRAAGTVHGAEAATNNPNKCNGDTSIADACVTGLCTYQTCPYTYGDCTAAGNQTCG
jgi:hypothetical protein